MNVLPALQSMRATLANVECALCDAAALVLALADPQRARDEHAIAPLASSLAKRLVVLGYLDSPSKDSAHVQDA